MVLTTIQSTHALLRITYGVVPIIVGIDKFFNIFTDWSAYLSPVVVSILPMDPASFMMIVGGIEIAAGILILTKWTRLGAYIVTAYLLAVGLNLVSTGENFDIALRDFVMAVGAFSLARLTEAQQVDSKLAQSSTSPRTTS